jgi:hypothetical protein
MQLWALLAEGDCSVEVSHLLTKYSRHIKRKMEPNEMLPNSFWGRGAWALGAIVMDAEVGAACVAGVVLWGGTAYVPGKWITGLTRFRMVPDQRPSQQPQPN